MAVKNSTLLVSINVVTSKTKEFIFGLQTQIWKFSGPQPLISSLSYTGVRSRAEKTGRLLGQGVPSTVPAPQWVSNAKLLLKSLLPHLPPHRTGWGNDHDHIYPAPFMGQALCQVFESFTVGVTVHILQTKDLSFYLLLRQTWGFTCNY